MHQDLQFLVELLVVQNHQALVEKLLVLIVIVLILVAQYQGPIDLVLTLLAAMQCQIYFVNLLVLQKMLVETLVTITLLE